MGGSLDDPVYRQALSAMRQLSREQGIDAVLRRLSRDQRASRLRR
ncbi:hypothetical protein [Herbihabitans rhizosphaerae]|nr:hypothetical protein [Herbihabitans rhizosphaerae]